MVAQKFGNADPDMSSRVGKGRTKERTDKPMLKPSATTPYTGMVGGPSNTARYEKGGKVAPYEEGGFRNAAMEHKR
jgi:hypothetical protein